MKLFSSAKMASSVRRKHRRGAAMPEAVIVFPVLLIIFSASIAAGKLHRAALTSQHDARREVHALCLAPVLEGMLPATFPPSTESISASSIAAAGLPPPLAPPTIFAMVTPNSDTTPPIRVLAQDIYTRIVSGTDFENAFMDARAYNSIRRKESSFANGYFATSVNTKGAAFFMCENGVAAPGRMVDSSDIIDLVKPYTLTVLFSRMTL